jgi:hypothetical protein
VVHYILSIYWIFTNIYLIEFLARLNNNRYLDIYFRKQNLVGMTRAKNLQGGFPITNCCMMIDDSLQDDEGFPVIKLKDYSTVDYCWHEHDEFTPTLQHNIFHPPHYAYIIC